MIAWAEGYWARLLFRLVLDCPYPMGSKAARTWCKGYRYAKLEER
jgi:hypothetical protein